MKSVILMAALVLAGASAAATAEELGDAAHGEKLFGRWCVACHGEGPGHPGTQALDKLYGGDPVGALALRTDLDPEAIHFIIRNGQSIMPFFRRIELSDGDIGDLSAYLTRNNPAN